eukprot:m.88048 g.88048  ORF g.88048 m.88048 type:complete len:55 (+) comp36554_c0_seq3:166-330(+)
MRSPVRSTFMLSSYLLRVLYFFVVGEEDDRVPPSSGLDRIERKAIAVEGRRKHA